MGIYAWDDFLWSCESSGNFGLALKWFLTVNLFFTKWNFKHIFVRSTLQKHFSAGNYPTNILLRSFIWLYFLWRKEFLVVLINWGIFCSRSTAFCQINKNAEAGCYKLDFYNKKYLTAFSLNFWWYPKYYLKVFNWWTKLFLPVEICFL